MKLPINSKNLSLKLAKILYSLAFMLIFELLAYPMSILAYQEEAQANQGQSEFSVNIVKTIEPFPGLQDLEKTEFKNLPTNQVRTKSYGVRLVTAYNSEPGQTDDSPCITANGFNLCKHGEEDSIAANFLAFGAKVRIPEIYGDRIFVVRDRMNKRFSDRVDVWMVDKSAARKFGLKKAKIEVILE